MPLPRRTETLKQYELKLFWRRIFDFNWKFGLFLIFIVCIPRFILVLYANASGNYSSIGLIMLISATAPFIFLTAYGRKKIGITKPKKYSWLLIAFIAGLIFSFLLYYLGKSLYGNSYENWYQYIGKSYKIPPAISQHDKAILFSVVTLTGITFSPIGEELFFRGIVHSSFEKSIGEAKSSIVESSAFAITHISHFGLVFVDTHWSFLVTPTLIWVSGMFLVSVVFFAFRKYSGSILGAIICHAAFNLGMIYCIFYLL
jgi:membrane protease YdiL (CAAX protease family)